VEICAVNPTFPLDICVPLVAVLIAAATDLRSFKIYNMISMPLLVSGLVYHGVVAGKSEFVESLLGALFGFTVLILLYTMGGVGAGDVKLLAAVGAWLGLPRTVCVFLASSLAAGGYAVFLLVWYQTGSETLGNLKILWHRFRILGRHIAREDGIETVVHHTDCRRRLIPFGAMIALGLIVTLVWELLWPVP
jgi:Flp pilus assembly protein protease CpaA